MDIWEVEKCIIYWARHGSLRGWELLYILSASWIFERLRIALYIERVMDLWEVQSAEDVENENLSSAEKIQQFRGQPAVHDPTVSQRTLD